MLINYYKQSSTLDLSPDESPIVKGHEFTLNIVETSLLDDENSNFSCTEITGILTKLPTLHYSTKWGNSPAASVTDVVKKITEHKYLKMFAMNNPKYRPPIVTDGWTQQVPQSGEPISYDLEFRAYPIDMLNTTAYPKIIDFLISATTPKKYVFTDSVRYIGPAAEQAYKKGENIADILNNLSHDFDSNTEYSKTAAIKKALDYLDKKENNDVLNNNEKALAQAIADFINELNNISSMAEKNTGGCPLIKAYIPNFCANKPDNVPWIITSWSFKPAINVTNDNYPIYLDFKITIETQYVLTSENILKGINQEG